MSICRYLKYCFLLLLSFSLLLAQAKDKLEKATFAGGCFWCMEAAFEKVAGVVSVTSGYSGGKEVRPTYQQVSSGKTNHREAIQIVYNPKLVRYSQLLSVFWRQINPTDRSGQFADRGKQYTTAIFYHNDEQRKIAEKSRLELEKSAKYKKPIVTAILPFTSFYEAEAHHQDYYKNNAVQYEFYKYGSGREQYLKELWGK